MYTLSKYIEELQDILDKEGDLPLIFSSDDEGNSYQKVEYLDDNPVFVENFEDSYFIDSVIKEEELSDYDQEDLTKVLIIN